MFTTALPPARTRPGSLCAAQRLLPFRHRLPPIVTAQSGGVNAVGRDHLVADILIPPDAVPGLRHLDRNDVGCTSPRAHPPAWSGRACACAPPAGLRFDQDEQVAGVGVPARDDRSADTEEVAAGEAIGQYVCQRL